MNEEEIKHFGIPGMKWGVRKEDKRSSDHIVSRDLKKKSIKEMTNTELQQLNKRLQLEQSYRELSLRGSSITRGHEFVKGALAMGTTMAAVYAFSQTPLFKAVKTVVTKKLKSPK